VSEWGRGRVRGRNMVEDVELGRSECASEE
jgi:hypothetical protein